MEFIAIYTSWLHDESFTRDINLVSAELYEELKLDINDIHLYKSTQLMILATTKKLMVRWRLKMHYQAKWSKLSSLFERKKKRGPKVGGR